MKRRGPMNATVAQLTARSLLGRRRALLLLALPGVLLLLSALSRGLAGEKDNITVALLGGFALSTLVPLLGLIAGTGAIGPEIDDGSIVYLLSKPLSRFSIVITKVAVAVGVITAFAALPTLLAGLILSGTSDRLAVAYALGALVAGIAYGALFLLLAVVTRHAVVVGLLYALIWESIVGSFVPGAQAVSIQQWALAFTEKVVGDKADGLDVTSAVGLSAAIPLLLVVVVGSTWFAGWRLRTLRLTTDE
jgi:ABC-2 type transport system permease protein